MTVQKRVRGHYRTVGRKQYKVRAHLRVKRTDIKKRGKNR